MQNKPTIAVIGGTGDLGSGLAQLWAAAGYPVIVGSRAKERAQAKAQELVVQTDGVVRGDDNRGAAQAADIVVLCVPYANHDATLEDIKPAMDGKILVDAVVPLVPPKVSVVQLPAAGSPAAVAQRVLGPQVRVAAAFHNVGAKKLHGGEKVDCDVLVFADDADVRERIIALAGIVATPRRRRRKPRQCGRGRGADLGLDCHQPALQGSRFRYSHYGFAGPRNTVTRACSNESHACRPEGSRCGPAGRRTKQVDAATWRRS